MEVNKMKFFFILCMVAIVSAVSTLITAIIFNSLVLGFCFCGSVLLMICGMIGMVVCDHMGL
jgi:hypothetical protein